MSVVSAILSMRVWFLALGLPFFFLQQPCPAQETKPAGTESRASEMTSADNLTLKRALAAYDQGHARQAEPLLRDLTRRYPTNFAATETLGLIYAEGGDFPSAIPLLEKACAVRASSASPRMSSTEFSNSSASIAPRFCGWSPTVSRTAFRVSQSLRV